MKHYVIIGNSAAAVGCVEGIRQVDTESNITLISSEPYHTYSRPLISYLLYGKTDEQRMKYRSDDFYEKNGCEVLLGKTVTAIDPQDKTVTLDDGQKISYSKLLVATGSKPFVPKMEGIEQVENKFTFMSLDDAKALEKAISPDSRVLIVGAGLIGLKCAEGISDRVKSIAVVDLADRILPSILDETGSKIIQSHIEKHNVTFYLSDSVKRFTSDCAVLNSGKEISFDVLVVAVGVRPNVSLVEEAGGAVRRGIVTDESCRTSLEDVYAAGDCAESHDITTDQDRVLALLPNAYMQGECAGMNMAGGEKLYENAIPMNAIGFWGLHVITAGSYDGESYEVFEGDHYKKLVTKDGLLKGYILIGEIERAGIYTSLIRNRVLLSSIDYELMKDHPQLMAFSRAERKEMLSTAHL
jgi:NAD(P)H-nitrite reductase large subunit